MLLVFHELSAPDLYGAFRLFAERSQHLWMCLINVYNSKARHATLPRAGLHPHPRSMTAVKLRAFENSVATDRPGLLHRHSYVCVADMYTCTHRDIYIQEYIHAYVYIYILNLNIVLGLFSTS